MKAVFEYFLQNYILMTGIYFGCVHYATFMSQEYTRLDSELKVT